MLQARLLRLSPELRRVLRAASVFGAACWRDGIIALLGGEEETSAVELALQALSRAEILERRVKSRFPTQVEYGWRNALMQQAAYSLLSDRDRALAHAQAAAFLLACGSGEPAELAAHYEHGGDRARALPYYLLAAEHAYDQMELQLGLRYLERAEACGASAEPEAQARAALLKCTIYRYQGDHERTMQAAELALSLLPRGDGGWYRVLFNLSLPLRVRGARERVVNLVEQWASADPLPGMEAAQLETGAWFTVLLAQMAEAGAAKLLWQRVEQVVARQTCYPEYLHGLISFARSEYLRVFANDPWRQLCELNLAVERLTKSGAAREASATKISLGQALAEIGDLAGGLRYLESCLQYAEKLRQPYIVLICKAHLMATLAGRAETRAAAINGALEILGMATAGNGYHGWAHSILGEECLRREALEEAADHLEKAVALSAGSPLRRLIAESLRVHLLLRMHKIEAAHALASALLTETAERGDSYCTTTIRLAAICARWHAGDHAGAAELQRATAETVLRRARQFPDEATRLRYLSELKENQVALSEAPWLARFPL